MAIIVLLVVALQAGVFFTISNAANRNAVQASQEALQLTARSLQAIMLTRESTLRKNARLLSNDHALKTLVSEGDADTILSAFQSYQARLGADTMVLLDMEGQIQADSQPQKTDYSALIGAARTDPAQESSGILVLGQRAYQMVLVPLKAPTPIAWLGIGFAISDRLTGELEQQTHTHVSLMVLDPRHPVVLASTLSSSQRGSLLAHPMPQTKTSFSFMLQGHPYMSLVLPLNRTGNQVLLAVLQRSLDDALAGFRALRWQLLGIFLLSTLLAALAGMLIARRVTRPVERLAQGAEQIRNGQYQMIGDIGQNDEFGELAQTFDNMVRGLMERDQVRSLLGKVVSSAVAEELLSRRIELGGEEREVTILFSDIRGFTGLAEGRSPSTVLALLNTYLSQMSELIDEQQGVVDKYIGDAVMALFGAPISAPNDPMRAMACALAMVAALPKLNQQFAASGWPELSIGIGVHTGNVVAGNVGSTARLNYTVLGDNVNLAARLEGLCKKYLVGIVASDATVARCPHIAFRELDRVRVKGKRQAVGVYQALAYHAQLTEEQTAWLGEYEAALALYRAAKFEAAQAAFISLPQDAVTELYRGRCARFLKHPPDPDWDAIETLDEK